MRQTAFILAGITAAFLCGRANTAPGIAVSIDRAMLGISQTADHIRDDAQIVVAQTNSDAAARLDQFKATVADIRVIEARTSLDINTSIRLIDAVLAKLKVR